VVIIKSLGLPLEGEEDTVALTEATQEFKAEIDGFIIYRPLPAPFLVLQGGVGLAICVGEICRESVYAGALRRNSIDGNILTIARRPSSVSIDVPLAGILLSVRPSSSVFLQRDSSNIYVLLQ